MTQALQGRLRSLRQSVGSNRREILLVLAVLAVSGILHGWNMFGYPYLENDEATYISRGWAFVSEGELDVYTYRYDHAPVGWMLIGGWLAATGADNFFGSMLGSGRILMLVVHLVSTLLVYLIGKRFAHGSKISGVIAALIFAASPLGIYFQRRVLLDNLMVMWLLLAVLLAISERRRLSTYIGSGVVFGIAVLTKLNAAFFGPGFLLLLWFQSTRHQRKHAIAHWLAFAGATVSLFFVYALLNNELFEAPLGADGEPLRVSLIDTFALQLGRGDFAWPWDPQSSFLQAISSWMIKDTFTLALGAAATLLLTIVAILVRKRSIYPLVVVVFIYAYVIFLARGKIVLDLYVTPLLPFLALAVGLLAAWALFLLPGRARAGSRVGWLVRGLRPAGGVLLVGALVAGYLTYAPTRHLWVDETTNQNKALQWVESNVEPDAVIAADNYVYPALAQEGDFTKTAYFFSTEYDPETRDVYSDDWRNVEYLVLTHEVVRQIQQGTVPRMRDILDHAELQADFSGRSSSFIDLANYISTNGDWAQVYRTKSRNEIVLQDSWTHFKDDFIVDYGQAIQTDNGDVTTSNDQAVAMEYALLEGDEAMFRGVWQWTKDHLQHRQDDSLISWLWRQNAAGEYELGNPDTVCGTDQRFLSLLLAAGDEWGDEKLAAEAGVMAEDFWRECTFVRDGVRYLDSSADGSETDELLNPSFFDPGIYRYLATKLPQYQWEQLIDGGYALLQRLLAERGTIPNWVVLTPDGRLVSASGVIAEEGADSFGDDSLKLIEPLILDEVEGEARSTPILDALQPQVVAIAETRPGLGREVPLAMLSQVRDTGIDPDSLYARSIFKSYDPEGGYWFDGENSGDHVWAMTWHAFQAQLPESNRVPLK